MIGVWPMGKFLTLWVIVATFLPWVSPATAKAPGTAKAVAVAVVYYRCDLTEGKNKKKHCAVHDGQYFVHNGIELKRPTPKNRTARIGHVRKWPKEGPVEEDLHICGERDAVKAAQGEPTPTRCCGHRVEVWRPFVWTHIKAYEGRPIAWMVDNDTENPHNGAFESFEETSDGKGVLHYRHFMSKEPDPNDREGGRKAFKDDGFELQSRSVKGDIRITNLKPTKALSSCDYGP